MRADVAEAARDYARRGWSVVPVHTLRDGRCSCGRRDCPAVAKHPRTRWEASMREPASGEQVAAWWRRWPDANIAVATGCVSGVAVLDVDPRSGGDDVLRSLEERWGALPETLEARSGGGGRHVWFAVEEDLPSAVLAPGLELKAERGAVIAPPSLHASGERYSWAPGRSPDDLEPLPVPDWLRMLALGDPEHQRADRGVDAPIRTTQEQSAFADAWRRAGVELRPGDHYYLCPFHPDHHPSLHVDSERCWWFCFGCRRGGGVGRLRRLLGEAASPAPRERRRGHVGEPRPVTLPGTKEVEVVGEASHQDELLALSGGQRPYGGVELEATAELVPELDDPYETYVLAVLVDGRRVGRLRLEDATALRSTIEAARAEHGVVTCRAVVRGGWDRGGDDVGRFGVVLYLPEAP